MRDVPELLVLHTLRLTGVAGPEVLAGRLGSSVEVLQPVLAHHAERGLVTHHRGGLPGWSLTVAGRARGEELLAEELVALSARGVAEACYERFVALNGQVLRACTDWQVVAGSDPLTLNEHADAAYDREVLDRLCVLHGAAVELLEELTSALARFGGYRGRLSNALARAREGGVDWVTRPVIDSYHTVWFELHEDLLATLGRTRSAERGTRGAERARRHGASTTGRTRQGERR